MLDLFITHYNTYPGTTTSQVRVAALKDLSACVRQYGIPETRRMIKARIGRAPFLTKILELDEEGFEQFWVKSWCYRYVYNGTIVHSHINYKSYQGFGGHKYFRGNWSDEHETYHIHENLTHNPIYEGYSLLDWITNGELCESCGTPFISLHGEADCPSCTAQYGAKSYSHRVEDDLGFEDTKEIRFGIELEYENITGKQVYKTLKGHAQAKRDGSIRNGVEIVTRPACIKTHKESLYNFFKQVPVEGASNTGMHVHVEKKRLSQYQIGFIMQFLNNRTLSENIKIIAGRDYVTNHYTSLKEEHTMTYGLYYDDDYKKTLRERTDKYSALNTAKEHTVEVRIFASPENADECFARLDFVNALVKYSSPYSVSVKTLKDKFSWTVFSQFVKTNKKDFPHLYTKYMKEAV